MIGPWPPEIEMIAGALGISLALWSIQRRQEGRPIGADSRNADVALLIFGSLTVLIGAVRLLGW